MSNFTFRVQERSLIDTHRKDLIFINWGFVKNTVNIETAVSYELDMALSDIATKHGWKRYEVYNKAISAFVERWKAGKTSRRYFGIQPQWKQKTIPIDRDLKPDLDLLKYKDGISIMVLAQEALHSFAESNGYDLPCTKHAMPDPSSDDA